MSTADLMTCVSWDQVQSITDTITMARHEEELEDLLKLFQHRVSDTTRALEHIEVIEQRLHQLKTQTTRELYLSQVLVQGLDDLRSKEGNQEKFSTNRVNMKIKLSTFKQDLRRYGNSITELHSIESELKQLMGIFEMDLRPNLEDIREYEIRDGLVLRVGDLFANSVHQSAFKADSIADEQSISAQLMNPLEKEVSSRQQLPESSQSGAVSLSREASSSSNISGPTLPKKFTRKFKTSLTRDL